MSEAHVRAHLFADGRSQDFDCSDESLAALLADAQPGRFLWLHIAGTEGRAEELGALDRERPVAAYCKTGYRASIAASVLKQAGFEQVASIPGSFTAWQAAGLPVEK